MTAPLDTAGMVIETLVEELRSTRTPGAELLCIRAAAALEAVSRERYHWLGEAQRISKSAYEAADALTAKDSELAEARAATIDECLAAIDALKNVVPVQGDRVRFSIYDLTRAFRAGIQMAREDVEALRARTVLSREKEA